MVLQEGRDSQEAMEEALNFVVKWGGLLAVILIPIWPLLALPAGVFSEGVSQLSATSLTPSSMPLPKPSGHYFLRIPLESLSMISGNRYSIAQLNTTD